jgi:putative acyl-CoA dehydrogenase
MHSFTAGLAVVLTRVNASRPRNHLETHDVANQPAPFEDANLFTSDVALQAAVAAPGGEAHADRISAFGARTGSTETAEWTMLRA